MAKKGEPIEHLNEAQGDHLQTHKINELIDELNTVKKKVKDLEDKAKEQK